MRDPVSAITHLLLPAPVRFAALLAAALATGSVAAEDLPVFRAGMWEFDRTIEASTATGKPQTIQTRTCTSPTSDMKAQNEMLTRSGCRFSGISRAGNKYSFSAVCSLQGASGTSKSELTADGDSAYSIRIESNLGGAPSRELLRARRVGDCRP